MSEQRSSTLVRDLLIATVLLGGLGAYLLFSPGSSPPDEPAPTPTAVATEGTQVTSSLVVVKKTETQPKSDKPYDPSSAILIDLLKDDTRRPDKALGAILAAKDVRFVPVLADLYGMTLRKKSTAFRTPTIAAALQRLTRQPFLKWADWYRLVAGSPKLEPPPDYSRFKPALYARADKRYARLLAHGVPTRIRLAEVCWNGRRVGQVPPLNDPKHVKVEAAWLQPQDLVVGVALGEAARAYPLRLLDAHEVVNDRLGPTSIAVLLDPLCGAPRIYQADLKGQRLRFFNSGLLYRGNKLLISGKGTLWQHMSGLAVVGPRAGQKLSSLPTVVTTWAAWRAQHPATTVLAEAQTPKRDYTPGRTYGAYYAQDTIFFPSFPQKPLLPNKRWVIGVHHDHQAAAFALDPLLKAKVKNTTVGATTIALIATRGGLEVSGTDAKNKPVRYAFGAEVRAYLRGEHTLKPGPTPDALTDAQGRAWQVREDALHGPGGLKLQRVRADLAYWFAWVGFHPETTLEKE